MRRQYNRILHDLAASDLLADLVTQLTGVVTTFTKADDFAAEVLQADYALS